MAEIRRVREVVFFYPDGRANAPSGFISNGFNLDPDADTAVINVTGESVVFISKTCARITIAPGWLWVEDVVREYYVKPKA